MILVKKCVSLHTKTRKTKNTMMISSLHSFNFRRGVILLTLLFAVHIGMAAFTGSDLTDGQKYYLFNIYQSKFLGADNKLQAPNIGTPLAFTASATGFTIGGTAYTATKNAAGYYQLKNGSNFFAFEDKVADPESPGDENRAMYMGGGVLCQNTTNDTDRSYWQLISETEYAEWQAKKKFTVASLNVDGMPKSVNLVVNIDLNPDATEGPGAQAIGRCLLNSGFDVVGVSENFNYHGDLWDVAWNGGIGNHYNAMTHRGPITVGNANLANYISKKPLFDIDGLNVYYRIDGSTNVATPSNESWTQWNDHYGYTDHGADGLIKKGFRYYLVTLADGTEIDLYTMHMDAESDKEDCDARTSQMRQLVFVIKATNNKRPIIIIGDSNCRYTRDTVKKDLIDAVNEDPRFTIRDPWIQFGRNNSYPAYGSGSISAAENGYRQGEVVDKIWYINNTESSIRLVAETYHQDLSFVASQNVEGTSLKQGSPLCDHKPCVVTFSYHNYDPLIDDVAIVETSEEAVYLRNRATGRFLMNGGWWGSHAVVGNYAKPYYVKSLPNGKYDISSTYGHITDAAYVDNNNSAEYIVEWTILEEDGFKVLSYKQGGQQKALTSNDPTYFNNNPLYRYVTTAPLNVKDKLQQWEIVTKAQLDAEMAAATATNPVNVTHLIKSANFDRIDWGAPGWTFDNKGNESWGNYSVTENIGGTDNDAFSNFNRSVSTKKVGTSSKNQWDCYQELKVPAGYYQLTCQGFEKGTQCTYLYAWSNPEGSYNELTQLLAKYNNADFSSGDTQANAGAAFNENKYINKLKIIKVGNDGKLVIGVKKTGDNSTAGWMVFDNFQLYYLGTENPNTTYEADVIETTKIVEKNDDNTAWKMSGTWRESDMANLETTINEDSKLLLDATNATLIGKPELPVSGNTMIKAKDASLIANTQNVIVDDKCEYFVLTDKKDFGPGMDFTATATHYTRTNTQGYNTVCMPFATKVSDYIDCKVYELSKINDETISFTEMNDDADIEGGKPVLVYSEEGADWTFDLSNRDVVAATSGNTEDGQQSGLNGSFLNRELGAGYYKLNSTGTAFVQTKEDVSTITPFRFYLKEDGTTAAAKSFAVIINGEETSIDNLLNDPATHIDTTYDLNGRKVLNISRPGLYIRNGKKVFIK